MKKNKWLQFITILSISILLAIVSCDAFSPGLGDKLDITAPVLSVDQANESYVSGDITLTGTYQDDGTIKSITLFLDSVATDFQATIDEKVNSWSISIPTQNYSDGSYEITVNIADSSGKSSKQTLVLYFDNHAPVVLVKEPLDFSGTYNGDITIRGEVADKFRIASVDVLLFDAEGVELDWIEGGVSLEEPNRKRLEDMTNSWSFEFDSGSYTEETGTFIFKIIATDLAGNSNSYYYSYSDLLSINDNKSFSVDELELLEREGTVGDGMLLTQTLIQSKRLESISLNIDQKIDLPSYEFDTPSLESMILTDNLQAFGRILDDDGVNVSSIEISLNGGSWESVDEVPDANSLIASWSHDLSHLGEGHYTLKIRCEDIYGTGSESDLLNFVIDTQGPSISLLSPASGAYKNSGFNVTGLCTDNVGVSRIEMSVDGGEFTTVQSWGPEDILDEYNWLAHVPQLQDGSHTLRFRAVDFSDKSSSESLIVNLDAADPVVTFLSPQSNATANGMIQVHGSTSNQSAISELVLTVTDGSVSQSYTLNDEVNEFDTSADLDSVLTGSAPSGSASTYYFWYKNIDTTMYADNHPLTLSLHARDVAGNQVTSPRIVQLNQSTDIPVFYFDNMSTGTGVTALDNSFSGSPSLIGRILDDDGVNLNSIEVEVDESGNWIVPTLSGSGLSVNWEFPISSIDQGVHTFRVRASDIYKNTKYESLKVPFIYDTGVPTMSISEISWGGNTLTSGFQGAYVNKDATIRGNASDGIAVASVAVNVNGQTDGGVDLYTTIYSAGTSLEKSVSWEYLLDMDSCSEGNINLKFRAEDSTGKVSYSDLALIKDTKAPEIEFTDLYGSTQRVRGLNGLLHFKGTASDENRVDRVEYALLKDDGSITSSDVPESGWTMLDQKYSWSFWMDSTIMDDGKYVLFVRARDSSGNNSANEEIEANRYNFILKQESDLPVISFNNLNSGGAANNLIGLDKTTLTGKVSDDDGLSRDSITIHFENGAFHWDDSVGIDETSDGLTEYSWYYDLPGDEILPQRATPYKITLSATDIGETGGDFTKTAVSDVSDPVSAYLDRTVPVLTETGVGSSELLISSSVVSLSGEASDENELTSLTLSIDGGTAEELTVDSSSGSWNFSFNDGDDSLSDGQYALVLTATDAAGRKTWLTRNIYIDATPPEIHLSVPVPEYVDESLSISGTAADPGAKASGVSRVQYSLDGNVDGEGERIWQDLNGTTVWSGNIDTSTLAEGSLGIRIRAVDGGNRTSQEIIRTFNIDHEAPRAQMDVTGNMSDIHDETYTREAFVLSGTADDALYTEKRAAFSSVLSYTRNGGNKTTVTLVPETDGSWIWNSLPVIEDDPATANVDESENGLLDGLYVFTLTVSDAAGKISTAQKVLTVDTTPPSLSVSSPVENEAVEEAEFTISGTARDTGGVGFDNKNDVEYSLDNLSWSPLTLSGISWSKEGLSLSGQEGIRNLYTRSTDALGNQSSSKVSFYYDIAAPVITETGYSATSTMYESDDFTFGGTWTETNGLKEIQISYTKDGGSPVDLYLYKDTTNPKGEDIPWSYSVEVNNGTETEGIEDGLYEFTITAVDQAKRTTSLRRIISVDTTSPTISAPPSLSGYYDESVTLSGTAEDPGADSGASGVSKVLYSLDDGATWKDLSGTTSWSGSIEISTLAEGSLDVLFKAIDKAANESVIDSHTTIQIDHTAPRAQINAEGTLAEIHGEVYTRKDFTLSGIADDDAFNTADGTTVRAAASAVLDYTRNGGNKTAIDLEPGEDGKWSRTFQLVVEDDPATTDIDESKNGLSDGLYVFTLTVTDVAGKTTSAQQVLIVDTTAPALSTSTPATKEVVESGSFKISGTTRDTGGVGFDGIEDVEYQLDNGSWKALTLDGMEWSDTLDLSSAIEGAKWLHLRTTDAVGNRNVSDIQFYYDLNPPELTETGIGSTDTYYLNDNYAFEGKWTESNELKSITVAYKKDGGPATEFVSMGPVNFGVNKGNLIDWSCSIPVVPSNPDDTVLSDGVYEFTITITDGADRTSVLTRNVQIDRELPSLDSYTIVGPAWSSSPDISVSGTASDQDGSGIDSVEYCLVSEGDYHMNEGTYQIDNDADSDVNWSLFSSTLNSGTTSFNAMLRLNNGTSLLLLRCTDKAGNEFVQEASKWQPLKVDTLEPAVSITSPEAGQQINADSDIMVNVDYSDEHSGVKSLELSVDNFSSTEDIVKDGDTDTEGGTITFEPSTGSRSLTLRKETLSNLNPGSHTLYVRAVDDAGNVSTVSSASFILDKKPPEGEFISHTTDSVINKTVNFSGSATDEKSLNPVGKFEIWNSIVNGNWEDISADVEINGIYNWNVNGFDSTAYETSVYDSNNDKEGIQYRLRLELSDYAGNVSHAEITLTADQDVDRPEIKLNNLTLDENSSANYIWLKQANVIYGTISDDDGVKKLEVSLNDGADWKEIPVFNGSWTYEVENDGAYTMLFRVTDGADTVFTASQTNDYSLETPMLSDNGETPRHYGKKGSANLATALNITVDTQTPDVTSTEYWNSANQWSTALSSATFGGTVHSVQLRQFCYDANSIDTVEFALEKKAGDDAAAVYSYTGMAGSETQTINGHLYTSYGAEIDIAPLASGTRTLSITVTDKASLKTKSTLSLIVDNTAPTMNLDSHTNNDQVSGTVTLKGSSGGSAEELIYKVTQSAAVPVDPGFWTVPLDASNDPDYTTYGAHRVLSALSSWRVNFDDDINNHDGFTHDRTLKRYIVALDNDLKLDESGSVVYKSDNTKYTTITTLYIHFRATDAYGNTDDTICYTLKVDPQGDIPIVSMTYPAVSSHGWYNDTEGMVYTASENPSFGGDVFSDIAMNTRLGSLTSYDSTNRTISYGGREYDSQGGNVIQGGILRIQGTAEDDKSITGIYLQIDPGYDPADGFQWDNSSAAAAGQELLPNGLPLNSIFSGKIEKFSGDPATSGPADQFGIKIGDSISWSYSLNTDGEFNGTGGLNNQIALRIFAVDEDGNISSLDTARDCIVTIDSAAPRIGSSEPLYLYQYDGTGNVTASMEYTDGMWLKGEWWLEGSVEDESGISSVTMTNCSDFQTVAVPDDGTWTGTYGYRIKALVGSDADTFGTLSYTLTAVDNDNGNSRRIEKQISLNFDNKPPELFADTDAAFDINKKVLQSNGFYSLGSGVSENSSSTASQSGFARVAFYFLRRGQNTKAVYDTWYLKDNAANKIEYETLHFDSGLYWMKEEGIQRDDNLMVLKLGAYNPNIHPGGLVKMGGSLYTITSVSGNTVIIDGSPESSEKTAYFAVAQIVDHQLTESNGSHLGANGYYTNVINDDDDCMVESVAIQGGTAIWDANINSRNIPDGPIEIHYVAFDRAGNSTAGVVEDGKVANNAPRLAAVWYGTDDNGNGTVDTSELTGDLFGIDQTASYDPNDTGIEYDADLLKESYTMGSKGDPLMTIKGNVTIIPEIVGGNGDLFYEYNVTKADTSAPYYRVNVNTAAPWAAGTDYSGSGDNSEILDTAKINLTLEDFLSPGDTGAEIVDGDDQTFNIIFWDSTEESEAGIDSQSASLSMVMDVALRDQNPPVVDIDPFYWNSKTDSSTAGLDGHIEVPAVGSSTKPAVSGKVKMTGTIEDDQLVNKIYINIDGNETLIASYDSGSEDKIPPFKYETFPEGVVTFKAETEYIDNSGHKVNWSMTWDTSSISKTAPAKEDLEIAIRAEDRGRPTLTGGTITYEPNNNNQKTTVDVVPYIVKVETELSSIKSNNWSVYNRTARGHYPVRDDETIKVYGYNLKGASLSDGTSLTVTKDGPYDVASVNMADISASDELDLSVGAVKTKNNSNDNDKPYNQQPNGDNNENLTDDVFLDLWEMDSSAVSPVSGMIEQPVMKINPTNGKVGFAFVNGPLYFSMGNADYSAQYWMGSYDFFTSVGFTYDSLGYSYGVAAGGDINSGQADKFQFMTSRWGTSQRGQDGSYSNTNSLRLESIAQRDTDGTIIFNKQRIKSPSLASAVHGSTTNLYLAYYDDINEEIRFKAGSTASTGRTNFGSFRDYDTNRSPYAYRNEWVSMIAGSSTGRNAGEFVSIAVVSSEGGTVDDVVVAVWYDAIERCLWYTYNTTPTNNRNNDTDGSGWSEPVRVFKSTSDMAHAGEYCQIVADKSGGIHIAAYDPMNLDLVYAHLGSYNDTSMETCIVDGYGVVGSNITLDVAESAGGQWIPYIGYYATSCIKPKYAYKFDTSAEAPEGSINEAYTGDWEITVIPTNSVLTMGSLGNNKINIGVWKDKNWKLESEGVIETGSNSSYHSGSTYNADCWDVVYGNGSANPILGYAVKNGTKGFIETAQKK